MFSVTRKQLLEFKRDSISLITFVVITSVLLIMVLIRKSDEILVVLSTFCLLGMQVAGKFFANEASDKTLETIFSLPLNFYQVFFGKFLAMFLVLLVPVFLVVLTIIVKSLFLNVYSTNFLLTIAFDLIMMLLVFINTTMLALIISFKSSSTIECALRVTFPLILVTIPYLTFLELVKLQMNIVIITFGYVFINMLIFILMFLSIRKYNDKSNIMTMTSKRKA